MKHAYAELVKSAIINTMPSEKLGGTWRNSTKEYPHICKELADNYFGEKPKFCSIKGNRVTTPIHDHKDSKSLNSSQVMCINFFKRFFENKDYSDLLLALLRQSGLQIDPCVDITDAIFEYEPYPDEKTNFDFYLYLSNGQHISFEIKYTEAAFGTINAGYTNDLEKYRIKWQTIYQHYANVSPYLPIPQINASKCPCFSYKSLKAENCSQNGQCELFKFFQHYQISRNIILAKRNDIVVFLTPRKNTTLDEGRAYISHFNNPNIINLYWEDLVKDLLNIVTGIPDLESYYLKFQAKYLDIVP